VDDKTLWINAYERAQEFYRLDNENYFKRTQILMVVIQSALFLSLVTLYSVDDDILERALWGILAVSILGCLASFAWALLTKRQHQRLELCRYYMRYIESKLKGCNDDAPEGFCIYEKAVFYDFGKRNVQLEPLGEEKVPKSITEKITGPVRGIESGTAYALLFLWALIGVAALMFAAGCFD